MRVEKNCNASTARVGLAVKCNNWSRSMPFDARPLVWVIMEQKSVLTHTTT
jgi:hypothetical protein